MKFEITHSFFQTTKILHHYNINYTDILSKYNTNSKFRENSHVFSYYILKTIFNIQLYRILILEYLLQERIY